MAGAVNSVCTGERLGPYLMVSERLKGYDLQCTMKSWSLLIGARRLRAKARRFSRADDRLIQEITTRHFPTGFTILHATQFMEFLRGIAQSGVVGDEVRLPHAFIQPMAAEDVADAVAAVALAEPANRIIEIGGPEKFRLDELIGRVLQYDKDSRPVVTDPAAPYFGVMIDDNSLIPGPDAKLGATHFDWWLENVPPPPRK